MLLAGAVGTLLIGAIADRIGLRRTLVITQALLTPLILVFVYVGGVLGAASLMLVGMCVVGTFGVTMVLSQLYLPRHVGMASGLSIGLAMGVGGIAAVVLGAVADAVDLKTALTICALRAGPRRRAVPAPARAGAARPRSRSSRSRPELGCPTESSETKGAMATVQEFFEKLPTAVDAAQDRGDEQLVRVRRRRAWARGRFASPTAPSPSPKEQRTPTARSRPSEETLTRIINGEQNPTTAYMTGKLKISGDMGAALKLQKLF